MTADQLINYMIPPLKVDDDITRAKQWMDEFRVKQLPVVKDAVLLGYITEEMLFDSNMMNSLVGEYPLIGQSCFSYSKSHYYDVLKTLSDHEMEMVAILDANEKFSGVVLTDDIVNELSNTAMVNSTGAIILFKSSLNDYSLAEISRVVEMNGSMILGTNVKPDVDDPSLIEIVLRVNYQDVNQISSGLSKIGYQFISSYNTEDKTFEEKDRYSLLMKYLDP